jgi:PAS domain S-box-containing protein
LIEERNIADKALKESKKWLETILNSIQSGIVVIDAGSNRIVDVNPAASKMIGIQNEQILNTVHPEYIDLEGSENGPITDLKENLDQKELLLKRTDGTHIPVLRTVSRTTLDGSDYWIVSFTDISEKKKLEARLQQAQKMEAIGTLAGGLAHDFNNLLMGIQGRTSLMLIDADSTHPHYEHLNGIVEYVKSASVLTTQLLGFARGGKYDVKPSDLNELVINQNRLFGRTKKQIKIQGSYQKPLWTVEVDQGQMEQVLLNLYVNAWQAMPAGGELYVQTENVTLDDSYTRQFDIKPGRYVKISVTDTGIGMDVAVQQRIFDPFFTTKDQGKGSGLGLASVYGIIKNHKGHINVYSEKGKGTTFNIYLPASQIKVLLSSGYSINGQATEILNRGGMGFIQKPFSIEKLSKKIINLLK